MKVSKYLNHLARFSDKTCESGGYEDLERISDAYSNGLKSLIAISDDDDLQDARDALATEQFKKVF